MEGKWERVFWDRRLAEEEYGSFVAGRRYWHRRSDVGLTFLGWKRNQMII